VRPRILIVDDDPSFLRTVRVLLEREGFDVVGEALNGLDAVADATRLVPDLVLVDVNLPDIDGFAVADALTNGGGGPAIVLVSSREARDFGPLVQRCGARGFVAKADLSGDALRELVG
jgi:DNA-binding NarL/FixJ family response regulator